MLPVTVRKAWLLFVGVGWLLSAAVSWAAPSALSLAKEADKLYKAGKYLEAAKVLEQAYAAEATPVFLYNLARAYDQGGEEQAALDTYRKYVGLPSKDTQPELLKRANLSMDRLRLSVANKEAAEKVQQAEREKLEKEAQAANLKAATEAATAKKQRELFEAQEQARVAAQKSQLSGRKLAAFVVGGVAVAAGGTGLVMGLLANGSRSQFGKASSSADKQRLESATRTQSLIADISFATALAAAVAAVIVFPKGPSEPGPVSIGVVPSSNGTSLTVGGQF
jgi:tetratricopeptide (TPR) repeat protein